MLNVTKKWKANKLKESKENPKHKSDNKHLSWVVACKSLTINNYQPKLDLIKYYKV